MENFDPHTADYLEKPFNKGTLCAARFSDDECWYRAKIIGSLPGQAGKYSVRFIDFGNTTTVNIDTETRKLPAHLLQYEPLSYPAYFAYISTPGKAKNFGDEAKKYVEKHALDKK